MRSSLEVFKIPGAEALLKSPHLSVLRALLSDS